MDSQLEKDIYQPRLVKVNVLHKVRNELPVLQNGLPVLQNAVQELCVAHSCRDYGCVVRNCQEEAPLMCLMTHFR